MEKKYLTEDEFEDLYMGMIHSIQNNNFSSFIEYIEKGADVTYFNHNAIQTAAEFGFVQFIHHLKEMGENIHINNDYLFLISSSGGHIEVMQYLIENGVDIHTQEDGALSWACEKNSLISVQFLVENGCDINKILSYDNVPENILNWVNEYKEKEKLSQKLELELKNKNNILHKSKI